MIRRVGIVWSVLLASVLPATAAAPNLQAGVLIQDGGSALSVDMHAAPEVVDWNNDGKKDLLVGQFGSGKIAYFRNTGTDASPAFNGGSFIRSGASDIAVGGL